MHQLLGTLALPVWQAAKDEARDVASAQELCAHRQHVGGGTRQAHRQRTRAPGRGRRVGVPVTAALRAERLDQAPEDLAVAGQELERELHHLREEHVQVPAVAPHRGQQPHELGGDLEPELAVGGGVLLRLGRPAVPPEVGPRGRRRSLEAAHSILAAQRRVYGGLPPALEVRERDAVGELLLLCWRHPRHNCSHEVCRLQVVCGKNVAERWHEDVGPHLLDVPQNGNCNRIGNQAQGWHCDQGAVDVAGVAAAVPLEARG
mmetsp:Transcript_89829/g.254537  ORF Transcript_89829/g.254537 Transcript_89829/m.254537 type:complete len:261 (-) Transcript_89829:1166-1948(-)